MFIAALNHHEYNWKFDNLNSLQSSRHEVSFFVVQPVC